MRIKSGIMQKTFTSSVIIKFYTRKAALFVVSGWLLTLPLISGCVGPARDPYAPRIVEGSAVKSEVLGYSVQGRPIECRQFGDGGPAVLFIATIHGSEPAGTDLLQKLMEQLYIRRSIWKGKTIAVVPSANPDGYAMGVRENARGVDLNRNFATDNRIDTSKYGQTALSEPESQILAQLIVRLRPACVISIHQPLDCLDYDGPGEAIAQRMAMFCPLEVKKLGPLPGSMGSYIGEELGIPIITMELPGEDRGLDARQLWQLYGQALLSVINFEP